MSRQSGRITVVLTVVCAAVLFSDRRTARSAGPTTNSGRVLVVVNGSAISRRDVDLSMLSRRIPKALRSSLRKRFLQQLIDRRLIAAFLADRKAKANPEILDAQMQLILKQIRKAGDDPKKVLAKLGFTAAGLRRELALPLAWNTYTLRVISNLEIKKRFLKHRPEYDGTELRARQILLKISQGADRRGKQAVIDRLAGIRAQIVGKKITFAAAAKKHSAAPSGRAGGELGFFAYRGRIALPLSQVAFSLKAGEVSQPFVTPFGVHLLQVTGRKPGQLSLEDARRQIFKQLAAERWTSTAKRLRRTAKIEWKTGESNR
ncbi:MAG: peptidylprolyl isomerase [Planctomycetes bacterium]|nr:peptidylprolyl isomerase [Planctomycetota bacterium]